MKYVSITIATFFITSSVSANEKARAAITNDIFSFITHPIQLWENPSTLLVLSLAKKCLLEAYMEIENDKHRTQSS